MDTAPIVTDDPVEFSRLLHEGGALLALDLGTKTVGVATCDPGWRFATAGSTIPRAKFAAARAALQPVVDRKGIRGFVVGLPKNMDGREGPRAQASRAYARNLFEAFERPVLLWDERWSTISAQAAMIGQDMSRSKRAERIDSHAAAIILQGAIDRLAGSAF